MSVSNTGAWLLTSLTVISTLLVALCTPSVAWKPNLYPFTTTRRGKTRNGVRTIARATATKFNSMKINPYQNSKHNLVIVRAGVDASSIRSHQDPAALRIDPELVTWRVDDGVTNVGTDVHISGLHLWRVFLLYSTSTCIASSTERNIK